MHGKIRWSIYDNTFKSIDDRYNRHVEFEVSFNTESIDSECFRMEMPLESRIIRKSDSGFCTCLEPDNLSKLRVDGDKLGLECFKPYSA
jgi:hypothetical protein